MDDVVLAITTAAAAPAAGSTDWIRVVGVVGLLGVWLWRGLAAVTSSRRNRMNAAAAPVADDGPSPGGDEDEVA